MWLPLGRMRCTVRIRYRTTSCPFGERGRLAEVDGYTTPSGVVGMVLKNEYVEAEAEAERENKSVGSLVIGHNFQIVNLYCM